MFKAVLSTSQILFSPVPPIKVAPSILNPAAKPVILNVNVSEPSAVERSFESRSPGVINNPFKLIPPLSSVDTNVKVFTCPSSSFTSTSFKSSFTGTSATALTVTLIWSVCSTDVSGLSKDTALILKT